MTKEAHIEAMVFYDHGNNGAEKREIQIFQEESGETTWRMEGTEKQPFPAHFEAGLSCITDILIPDMRTPEELQQSPVINKN